jgi:hypothetical protein
VRGHSYARVKENSALGIHEARGHFRAANIHAERKCFSGVHGWALRSGFLLAEDIRRRRVLAPLGMTMIFEIGGMVLMGDALEVWAV